MKKFKGSATIWVVIVIIALVVLGIITYFVIDANNKAVHYEDYNTATIIEANDANGNIGDHVKGNANAPVILFEYANFQCSHCASMNPIIEQIIADSNGQLGVVFRNLTWSSFQNSKAAAAAAEAAGLQGYWEPYANKLFEEQAEWSGADSSERTQLFNKYFEEVTGGQGNLEQFNSDIASEAVANKVKFDTGISKEAGAEGTPAFYVEGQFIDLTNGGELTINGKTITYEPASTNADFAKIIQDIITAKTSE